MAKPTPTQQMKKPPTPEELISQYETRGLDPQSASLKVIDDLQNALIRIIAAKKKDKHLSDPGRRLDAAAAAAAKLAVIDAKLDSKPGFGETFAIGVASGLALNGIGSLLPHVVGAVSNIWNSARSVTKE